MSDCERIGVDTDPATRVRASIESMLDRGVDVTVGFTGALRFRRVTSIAAVAGWRDTIEFTPVLFDGINTDLDGR